MLYQVKNVKTVTINMVFDRRRYISELTSSLAFVSVFTTFFILIMCNIWFPYKLQNSVDNIHAVAEITSFYTSTPTSSLIQATNTSSSYVSSASVSLTSRATSSSERLIKKDIVQSVSNIESIALNQVHVYIIDTVYIINTTYAKNKNFSNDQFKNITSEVVNTLEMKSNMIDKVIEKLNESTVSVNIGYDAASIVNQTDLKNLKLNYNYFDSFLNKKRSLFQERFKMDNLVNTTKYKTNLNHNNNYNFSLNSTQLKEIDLLLSGYFSESAKTKREYAPSHVTTEKSKNKKTVKNLTVIFCILYCLGIVFYFVSKTFLREKIEEYFLENQSIINPSTNVTDMKSKRHQLRNCIINTFIFLKTNTLIFMFWTILITEYCFVKYHINITYDSQTSLKTNAYFEKRADTLDFANTLSENIETFIKFNLFDEENGIVVSYVDKLGIESDDLKSNIMNTLKDVISTTYDTTFYSDFFDGNVQSGLSKRQITINKSFLETFFDTTKKLVLKYLRILIVVVSIFAIIQFIAFELHTYHSQ